MQIKKPHLKILILFCLLFFIHCAEDESSTIGYFSNDAVGFADASDLKNVVASDTKMKDDSNSFNASIIDECPDGNECALLYPFETYCLKSDNPEETGYKSACSAICKIDEDSGKEYIFNGFYQEASCFSLLGENLNCCGVVKDPPENTTDAVRFCIPSKACCYDSVFCGNKCCPEYVMKCTGDGQKCLVPGPEEKICESGFVCLEEEGCSECGCLPDGAVCCKETGEVCLAGSQCTECGCIKDDEICCPEMIVCLKDEPCCGDICCPEDQKCIVENQTCEPKCFLPAPIYCKNVCCPENYECVGEENGGFCKPIGADYCGFTDGKHRICSSAQKCLCYDYDPDGCIFIQKCLNGWDQDKCCIPWDANICFDSPTGYCLATEICVEAMPYCCSTNIPVPCGNGCCLKEEECFVKKNNKMECAIGIYCPKWDIICPPNQECNKCKSGCKQAGLEDCCATEEGYCFEGYYCTYDNPSCCKNETVVCKGQCCLYGEKCYVLEDGSGGICYDPNEDEVCYGCGIVCPAGQQCMKNKCKCILDEEVDCGNSIAGSTDYCGIGYYCVSGPQKCCKNGENPCGSICCQGGPNPESCDKYDDGEDVCIPFGSKNCGEEKCSGDGVCCKGYCYVNGSTCCGSNVCSSAQNCCGGKFCKGIKDKCCPWQGNYHKCSQSEKCCGNSCAPVDGPCCPPNSINSFYWGCYEWEKCCGGSCMLNGYSCCYEKTGSNSHCLPQNPICNKWPNGQIACCAANFPNPCVEDGVNKCCK